VEDDSREARAIPTLRVRSAMDQKRAPFGKARVDDDHSRARSCPLQRGIPDRLHRDSGAYGRRYRRQADTIRPDVGGTEVNPLQTVRGAIGREVRPAVRGLEGESRRTTSAAGGSADEEQCPDPPHKRTP